MSDFNYPLIDYKNNPKKCIDLLASYLNNGSLSVILGAGASSGFGLPSWSKLVIDCANDSISKFKSKAKYSNEELKSLIEEVKRTRPDSYIEIVKKNLYNGVKFDFSLITNKDLLIAITSLFIGKTRGTAKNVLTYNFDDVLEWYLEFNGLKVNGIGLQNHLLKSGDVNVLHIHGCLPHSDDIVSTRPQIVFSKKEFEDMKVGKSYVKELMYDFYKRNIFLSVGLSSGSLVDDLCPYLRDILNWYNEQGIKRGNPFGIAFLTSASMNDEHDLIEAGIIPCTIDKHEIPNLVFNISQEALNYTRK